MHLSSAMSRLLTALLCLTVGAAVALAYETVHSKSIENFDGATSLIRLGEQSYIALSVDRPDPDFGFMTEYAYELLSRYNNGWNYAHKYVPETTPMFVEMDVFDTRAERKVMFAVGEPQGGGYAPAPRHPLFFQENPETFYFTRNTTATDLRQLLEVAVCMLTDLSFQSLPFEGTKVLLALYDYPPPEDESKIPDNQIWVPRTMKQGTNGQCSS